MKPGLRGRYPVQSPKSRVDINNIGNVMRIPCSTAVLRAVSLVPGRNADTSAKKGIRKVYNKAEYLKEKRAALNKYAIWLMKAVA
jgi:hypothetical protein